MLVHDARFFNERRAKKWLRPTMRVQEGYRETDWMSDDTPLDTDILVYFEITPQEVRLGKKWRLNLQRAFRQRFVIAHYSSCHACGN